MRGKGNRLRRKETRGVEIEVKGVSRGKSIRVKRVKVGVKETEFNKEGVKGIVA